MAGSAVVGGHRSYYLRRVAKQVRAMVECEHCSVVVLRSILFSQDLPASQHPKIFFHTPSLYSPPLLTYYDERAEPTEFYVFSCCLSARHHELFSLEAMRALCDLAIVSEKLCCSELVKANDSSQSRRFPLHLAIVPLFGSAGLLGLLLCSDRRPCAFCAGECRLIEQYLPIVTRELEYFVKKDANITTPQPATLFPDRFPDLSEVKEPYEFISMIGHELRIPLTAIKGYVGLLQAYSSLSGPVCNERENTDENDIEMTLHRQEQYLSAIMEQSNHLETLISDLMDLSRLQSGRLAIRPQSVHLAPLCQHVVQLAQYRMNAQKPGFYTIRFCWDESATDEVWADAERVRQVLTNLIENAIKYSPHGGLIEVSLHSSSHLSTGLSIDCSHIAITVCDQGIGIPIHQQERLFQPFVRLKHAGTENVMGAGLGLYISRKFVEAMAGQITLRSQEGQGTSVTFTLPTLLPATPLACTASTHVVDKLV